MKNKKTIYKWLTNRFLLIIRNEENFAEKRTYSFNYAKLLVVFTLFLGSVFGLSLMMINTVLAKWYNPKYQQLELNRSLISLSSKVDSLAEDNERKEKFIISLKNIIVGDNEVLSEGQANRALDVRPKEVNLDYISSVDEDLRNRFESGVNDINYFEKNHSDYISDAFIAPVSGHIKTKSGKSTVLKVSPSQVVKSIADGTILFSYWTIEHNYIISVQHKNGFISIYKNCASLLKKAGDTVKIGEPISITGEDIKSNDLFFELWQNSKKIDPEKYILF